MGWWARLGRTFRGDRHRAEIEEELRFHLDMDAADGHDTRETRLRLGNLRRIEEDTRAVGSIEWLESGAADVRYGLRQLRRSPALATAVVLSLTIGVGANTAVFSLVDAAILRPLSVHDPASLRIIEWTSDDFPRWISNVNGSFEAIAGGRRQGSSVGANVYRHLAREQHVLDALVGIADPDSVTVMIGGVRAEQASLQYVSANFFQGLGVLPFWGRPFRVDEDRIGAEPVVVISDRFWVSRLARKDVRDVSIRINNVPTRIVGVAPPGFFGLAAGQWTDVYAPLATRVAFTTPQDNEARGEDDRDWWVRLVGRLKPGISEMVATQQLNQTFRSFVVPEGISIKPESIPALVLLPGRHGFDWALNRRDASALWILMLLVAVLLLIVSANVANLLLARAVGRQRESAVRLALGAGRLRLMRQHLIESGVFALGAGAAGLLLGYALARVIHQLFQSGRDPSNAFDLHVDMRVLAYTAGLSVVTALGFGLAPAVRVARADLSDALKAHTRSVAGSGLRLPRLLVAGQIALCLAALVAAGLLGRSLQNLKGEDLGFNRENLAYASVSPARSGYSPERIAAYVDHVRDELSELPGVLKVSTVQTRLLSGGGNATRVFVPGRATRFEHGLIDPQLLTHLNRVGEGFFDTVGLPLAAGRALDHRDERPNGDAVVVDELFAQHFFPNENPVGRRFWLGEARKGRGYEIVGVVGNSMYNSLRTERVPTVYQPYRPVGTVHFVIRTTVASTSLAEPIRKAIASVDPNVPLTEFHTQSGLIDRLLRAERLLTVLSGAFGVIALTLASIGLGGLLAYLVARRTNEIGIRMAVGASARDVMRMVFVDSLAMVALGIVIGVPCAFAVAKFLQGMLFRLEPLDLRTTVAVVCALLATALFAAWIPARRASHIDPMYALREE